MGKRSNTGTEAPYHHPRSHGCSCSRRPQRAVDQAGVKHRGSSVPAQGQGCSLAPTLPHPKWQLSASTWASWALLPGHNLRPEVRECLAHHSSPGDNRLRHRSPKCPFVPARVLGGVGQGSSPISTLEQLGCPAGISRRRKLWHMGAPEPKTSHCHLIQSPQEAWAIGAHFSNDTEANRST